MGIEANNNRKSTSFIGRFDFRSPGDMAELEMVKNMVRTFNNFQKERGDGYRWRVCLRGRQPFKKMKVERGYYTPGSVGEVSYNYHGNIVGGIRNASCVDVYIYRRA